MTSIVQRGIGGACRPLAAIAVAIPFAMLALPAVAAGPEWLSCISTFPAEKLEPGYASFPNAVTIGFVNGCRRQVVGLICVQDKRSKRWLSYTEPRRTNPGEAMFAQIMAPEDYASWNAIACYENGSCPATLQLSGYCAELGFEE